MSRYDYDRGWPAYVPVAERRRQAEREVAKLVKKGQAVSAVRISGRRIASTFWGKAWCDNLESYQDFENRLPRGRAYVRNSVLDLQIAPLEISAMVAGSSTYRVSVNIVALPQARWRSICADCADGIDSLVELLQGRLSKAVMARLCRQENGLFPTPSEMKFSCSCLDYAFMCKHVAAALYGVGARLDERPELLFQLRAVDQNELIANLDSAMPLSKTVPAAGNILEEEDLSALFGLDMGADDVPVAPSPKPAAKSKVVAAGAETAGKKSRAGTAALTKAKSGRGDSPKKARNVGR
jgi:uncharacterized Zn finger protein